MVSPLDIELGSKQARLRDRVLADMIKAEFKTSKTKRVVAMLA